MSFEYYFAQSVLDERAAQFDAINRGRRPATQPIRPRRSLSTRLRAPDWVSRIGRRQRQAEPAVAPLRWSGPAGSHS
jgi:hypothetical protein